MSGVVLVAAEGSNGEDGVGIVGLDLTESAANAALGALEGTAPLNTSALAVLVVQGAAICDCLAAPDAVYQRNAGGELVARFPRSVAPDRRAPPGGEASPADAVEVGAYTTGAALEGLDPEAGGLTEVERERRVMLLALRRTIRRVPEVWRVSGTADRAAAGWPLVIAAGARVVIALGVAYIASRAVEGVAEVVTAEAERRHQLEVQTAGAQYETRFRDWIARGRPPGGMAPPSELERSLAQRLRDDARSEWGEVMREAAFGVAKVLGYLALAYIGFRLLTGGKRNG